MKTPYQCVEEALRSQGARHPKAKLEALTKHLMEGGKPETYGERFAQMALQQEGYIDRHLKPRNIVPYSEYVKSQNPAGVQFDRAFIQGICCNCGKDVLTPSVGVKYNSVAALSKEGFTGDMDAQNRKQVCFGCMRQYGWQWGEKEEAGEDD